MESDNKNKLVRKRNNAKKTDNTESGLGTESHELDDDDENTCNDLNSTSDDLDDKKLN